MGLRFFGLLLTCCSLVACGSRSRLFPAVSLCEVDENCNRSDLCSPEICVAGACEAAPEVVCEPSNQCVTSECIPATGLCEETPVTPDEDQDGFRAPLPGRDITDPAACGNDCDDASASAHPGGVEVCDGTDNDCDGTIDNGSLLLPSSSDKLSPVRVAQPPADRAGASGIAFGAGYFALSYWSHLPDIDKTRPFLRAFNVDGSEAIAEQRINQVNSPSWGASLAWSGSAFGAAWSDGRNSQNYELYFTLFDHKGDKRIGDLQLTNASGMSLDPEMIYDQGRFLVVWPDRRNGQSQLFLQMLSPSGKMIGGNVELTPADSVDTEFPAMAAALRTYGLAYTLESPVGTELRFRLYEKEYVNALGEGLTIAMSSVEKPTSPRIVALRDRYLVTWHTRSSANLPGATIWGAVIDESGVIVEAPRPLTPFGSRARANGLASFGDRAILAWSDDVFGNYEIFAEVVDSELNVLEPALRLTDAPGDSIEPKVVRSDEGRIGVLFNDWREGPQSAYFMSFGCRQDQDLE
jgi:hypothetical protein